LVLKIDFGQHVQSIVRDADVVTGEPVISPILVTRLLHSLASCEGQLLYNQVIDSLIENDKNLSVVVTIGIFVIIILL